MVECIVWESNTVVRYRGASDCILSVQLSAGAKLEDEAIKNVWLL